MNLGKLSAIAVGAMALSLGAAPAKAQVLNVPIADWTGGAVSCKILQVILEDEMGYKLKRITMPSGPNVYEGIRAGDLDFACESWPSYSPSKDKYVEHFGGDGTVAYLEPMGIVGNTGYYVPRYLIEGDSERGIEPMAPDLKSYQDLEKYADLFKTIDTGDKGRLLACPVAAWQCQETERWEGLGVDYQLVELGSETAHWAEIRAAYQRGEPFIAYTWEPHWIHSELDLVEIELPPYSEDCTPACGWPKDVTFNYGRVDLEQDLPDVTRLVKNMNLSNQEQAGMIHAIDIGGRDMDEVVREWMASHEDVWRAWMPQS